jgi:hypothetical protein
LRNNVAWAKLKGLVFTKQVYSIVLVWALTWYSFWLLIKLQISAVNVAGMVISAVGLASTFSPIRSMVVKSVRLVVPHLNKSVHLVHSPIGSQVYSEIKIVPKSAAVPSRNCGFIQIESPPVQKTVINIPKQELQPSKIAEKSENPAKESNGCPKNLAYFTLKPRPKQTPEECITCKNLISCVCLTNN